MLTQDRQGTVFHYWISFWPVAPFFGVKWRFEKMMPTGNFFRPAEVAVEMAKAGAEEAARATSEAVEAFSHQVEAAAAVALVAPHAPEIEESAAAEPEGLAPEKPVHLFAERPADADDLKVLRGVGPKLEAMLNDMGVYTLRQIAGFTEANLAWVDSNLTAFKGRPLRDDWVSQARALV